MSIKQKGCMLIKTKQTNKQTNKPSESLIWSGFEHLARVNYTVLQVVTCAGVWLFTLLWGLCLKQNFGLKMVSYFLSWQSWVWSMGSILCIICEENINQKHHVCQSNRVSLSLFILTLISCTIHQLIHPKTTRPEWTWQMRNRLKILYDSSTVFYSLQFFYPKLLSRQVSLKTDALLF